MEHLIVLVLIIAVFYLGALGLMVWSWRKAHAKWVARMAYSKLMPDEKDGH